nr:translocation/assembly module TamB domain-containing protein [Bacteroides sp.]
FLQNMDIELRRIRLAEISEALPYLPQFAGVLSAEAHLVQTATSLQISTESVIDELVYEHQRVGDVGLGATWLPGRDGMHYVNSYLTHEGKEVMTLNGNYFSRNDSLDVESALEHFPLQIANVFIPDQVVTLSGDLDGSLQLRGSTSKPLANGELMLDSVSVYASQAGARYWFDNRPVKIENSRMLFNQFSIYTTSKNPFAVNGLVDFRNLSRPTADLTLKASNYTLLDAPRTKESLVYGKVFVDMNTTVRGPLDALVMRGNMNVLGNTDVTYVLKDSPLTVQDRLGDLVTFTSFADTLSQKKQDERVVSLGGLDMLMTVHIDPAVRLKADLSPDRNSRVELEGGGDLSLQYSPRGDLRLSGRYTLSGGILKYALPVIPLKEFEINDGSYVEWSGNPMDPSLNFKATERVRASVSQEGGSPRMVNFDVSVGVKNRMENLELLFNLEAPEDMSVQNELAAMSVEERSKQAIALLATGVYMAGAGNKSGGLDMGAALNSVLQKQIANVAGSALKTVNISFGMENYDGADAGGKRTDYNFRYAQRFFNNRVQVVIGGTISTGNETQQDESFIDNVSLEYRLDNSGTRYVRLFHNKDNESILEGEITETGVGIVLRKKMSRLSELFIFKRKK